MSAKTKMKSMTFILCCTMAANLAQAQQRGIINNAQSPHVKLKSINISDCQWTEGFWADSTQITPTDAQRWSNRQYHELYNSGHLLTSACIHYRVTGQRNFLEIAIRHADYLYRTFKIRPKELARFGFNQTQIMGLVELYRTTRNKEYLHLAEIFINMRGRSKVTPDDSLSGSRKT